MSANSGRASTRVHDQKVAKFFRELSRSGSVTLASERSGIRRYTLYRMRSNDEKFAKRWDRHLSLGIDRLQDDALRRAVDGVERPVWRGGKKVGTVQQYDNRLLQFLLRAHRPEIYAEKKQGGVPPLPFDLAERLAASQPRLDAHLAEKRAKEAERRKKERDNGES